MSKLKNLDDSSIHNGFYARFIKRPLDFFICLMAVLLLSPIFLILCFLVRIKLGSPVFFKQTRCGRDEKSFELIKFRTMTDARDENGNLLPDTDRFTKFGNFLRNYSLDELPELLNVIKGDMSIVGPRPLYTFYVPYYTEEEALRHAVRGGITGLAQVNGRALCRWNQRFAYDVQYVRKITFLSDVKIIWQTVYKVLKKTDIGVPSVTDEGGLHIIREVQRLDRVKEIGSSFSSSNEKGSNNYPTFITHREGYTVFLSTGRSCIREIINSLRVENKRVIVPAFTCESVIEPFVEAGYSVQYYSINQDLTVNLAKLKEQIAKFSPSVVLFHRYFGFDTCQGIEPIIQRQGIITIEDETQFMFSEPRYTWSDYQFGSIRKWGAFPDGAYLLSAKKVIEQPHREDDTFVRLEVKAMKSKQAYLDKKIDNQDYKQLFCDGRKYADSQKTTFSISCISNYNLESLNINDFISAHRSNAKILLEGLKGYSWFDSIFDSVPDGITPFMVPLLVHEGRKDFQTYLSSQKIFATVIWGCPEILKDQIDAEAQAIYDQILCIPCDHRYDGTDMIRIINAIRQYDKKRGK